MTRVATIAKTHKAIMEGSRNAVKVVLLPSNIGDYSNQENNTDEV